MESSTSRITYPQLYDYVSSSGALKTKIWITNCGSADDGDKQDEEGAGDSQNQTNYDGDEDTEDEDKAPQSAIENTPGSAINEPSDWKDDNAESKNEPKNKDPPKLVDSPPEIPPKDVEKTPPPPPEINAPEEDENDDDE